MENLNSFDWSLAWHILKDIVMPHSGTLIFNVIILLLLGLFLSILYIAFLSKRGFLKRKPKYYNWAVKLYVPLMIAVFLYIFGQIGFFRGVYKILNKETEFIVEGIYSETINLAFESEESKNEFINSIQQAAMITRDGSDYLVSELKKTAAEYNTGYSLADSGKDKIVGYLIEKYGDDIYKTTVYSMMNTAGEKVKFDVNSSLPYDEFSTGMDFLLNVGHEDIEIATKNKLEEWLDSLLDSQYGSMVKSLLIVLLIIIVLPLLEFFIYKKWIAPSYSISND